MIQRWRYDCIPLSDPALIDEALSQDWEPFQVSNGYLHVKKRELYEAAPVELPPTLKEAYEARSAELVRLATGT